MAREPWPIELRARRSPEQRCAFCHDDIGASAMACLRCQTLFHEDCAAEHGRCPTLGCKERSHSVAEQPTTPFVTLEGAGWRRFFAFLRLWTRLLVVVGIYASIGLFALLVTLVFAFGCSPVSIVGILTAWICHRAFQAADRERAFQNELRAALQEVFPAVVRVFVTRDGDGERVDLRPEGASPVDPAVLSLRFGLLGAPAWLRHAPRLRVYGLSWPGPAVLEDQHGRHHFAPQARVHRPSARPWRRTPRPQP